MTKARDWTTICHDAVQSTDEERAVLEAQLAANPEDVEARVKLVGALFMRFDAEHQTKRGSHLLWLATNRPEIALSGYGGLIEEYAPAERAALIAAWRAAAAKPDAALDVLDNATAFLIRTYPEEAEAIYRRAIALEPGDYEWRERLARALVIAGRPLEAIAELEAALERTDVDWVQLGLCLDLLEAAVMAKQWDRVVELAQRILADNETVTRTFQYGNAIHHANIALGWAALAHGEVAEAAFYLQAAAKTPGSPQLNSFGPDRKLADALLAAGERAAVRAYFEECRRFWEMHRGRLDEAIAAI